MRTILLATAILTSSTAIAQAHHHKHHRTHHARHHEHHSPSSITRVETKAGPIRVAAAYADRFVGFINALVDQGYKPKDIGCYSMGHMAHSKHHWGGACDIDQRRRNVTSKPMYHVTELAHKFHLTDGCEWHDADCGHIEVPTGAYATR